MPARSIVSAAFAVLLLCIVQQSAIAADAVPAVAIVRVPGGGVQPQAVVDDKGTIHLIYLAGDPKNSDIFYVHSADGGRTFSAPVRVNSQPGSAVALGTIRGPQLALGRGGRLHVGWVGSMTAEPKFGGKFMPMLYARSTDDGAGFEPQRDMIQANPGVDGGGSVAADKAGNVYVAWHAPTAKTTGEQNRHVWLSKSTDDGKTFAVEQAVSPDHGACGCCGLKLFADGAHLYALYRTADQTVNRDMTLLQIDSKDMKFRANTLSRMKMAMCMLSSSDFTASPGGGAVGAWESSGQVYWSPVGGKNAEPAAIPVPGAAGNRKHPAVAVNAAGQTLVVWTEGTGWNKGGSLSWQLYDKSAKAAAAGVAPSVPTWGAPATVALGDGSFVVFY